jgi:hypothetical protein
VTAGTFGKWPVLRALVRDDAHVTLTGVLDRLLACSPPPFPQADAGATVRRRA